MDYKLFQHYFSQNLSSEDRTNLETLCNDNTDAELLFYLVNQCKERVGQNQTAPQDFLSDDQIELLLIRLFSGTIHKKDARTFLNGLNDPLFFAKVEQILHVSAAADMTTLDDLQDIRIPTTDEIYKNLQADRTVNPTRAIYTFFAKLRLPQLEWKWIAVPATVVAAVALAILIPLQLQSPNELYVKYFDDSDVAIQIQNPSLPVLSGIRSSSDADSLGPNDSLVIRYRDAFSDYLVEDYNKALKKFGALEEEILSLDDSELNTYIKSEFNFYSGLCRLNLAGSRGWGKKNLRKSIDYLANSLESAQAYGFQHSTEAPFFLALAYKMNGDDGHVEQILAKYPIHTKYKTDAEQLRSTEQVINN